MLQRSVGVIAIIHRTQPLSLSPLTRNKKKLPPSLYHSIPEPLIMQIPNSCRLFSHCRPTNLEENKRTYHSTFPNSISTPLATSSISANNLSTTKPPLPNHKLLLKTPSCKKKITNPNSTFSPQHNTRQIPPKRNSHTRANNTQFLTWASINNHTIRTDLR